MNRDKVYLKGHVIGHAADTLGYQGLMVQLENLDIVEIDKNLVHKEIGEPQKVTVPQFVADWYEKHKDDFEFNVWDYVYMFDAKWESDFKKWINSSKTKPFQTLVNMHQFGYTVEKEKRYSVKIKGEIKENLLVYGLGIDRYFFARTYDSSKRNEHTRKELEEAGFGWVFDCPGIEIEEVEK